MTAFNPPVQKHTFAERMDRGKACLHRLRRFATECGMNIAVIKNPAYSAGFSRRLISQARVPVPFCLEHAKHDGADKGEGEVGGHDAQLADERTKGHGNPPKAASIANVKSAPLPAITRKLAIGFTPKKSAVLSIRLISAAHNRCDVVKES
jgi:hypothetical protein